MWLATPKFVERKFHEVEDGYIFYPKLRGSGYLVSQGERDKILQVHRWISGWPAILTFVVLYSIASVIWMAAGWNDAALIASAVITFLANRLGLHFWTVRAFKSRQPIARPKTDNELRTEVAVTTPWWALAWGFLAFGFGFTYIALAMVKFGADWISFGLWIFQIAGLLMIIRLIIAKRLARPSDPLE